MNTESNTQPAKHGWRLRLGIGLLAASALTGVVAEVASSAPASAAQVVVVGPKICGSSWS